MKLHSILHIPHSIFRWFTATRRRKILSFILILLILLTGIRFLFFNPKDAEAAWSSNHSLWAKRKRVPVVNNSGDNLASGTTVAITINTKELVSMGKLQDDCDDLRVVHTSGSTHTELTRYLSYPGGGNCATSEATKVYFKLNSALNNGSIDSDYYIYYANGSASSPSSTVDAFDTSSANALLVCPFDGTTECINSDGAEDTTTETGAIRYSGSKSAMSFDGLNDYATVTGNLGTGLSEITIETWLNQPTHIQNVPGIFSRQTIGNCAYSSGLYQYFDTGIVFALDIGGACVTTTAYNISTGWHHLAGVYNGSYLKLYVDGVEQRSTAGNGTFNAGGSNWYVGQTGNWTQEYGGLIDELRVSNIARYTENFTPSTSPFVRDEYTKLLFHFDENGDDPRNTGKAIDDSGNGNHGTITGAKYVAGLVGVDNGTTDTGKAEGGNTYAGHEGIILEGGRTNLITNPSFEHSTYDTNWSASASATLTRNTTAPYHKFGSNSAKMVVSGGNASLLIPATASDTTLHTLFAYVYDGTTGNIGGTVSSSVASLMFNATPITTTYTDIGGGWWRLSGSANTVASQTNYGVEIKDTKTAYIDGVQLEDNPYVHEHITSYIDGSLGSGYAWNGTENDSTSTRSATSLRYLTTSNASPDNGSISFWFKGTNNPHTNSPQNYLYIGGSGTAKSLNFYIDRFSWKPELRIVNDDGSASYTVTTNSEYTVNKWNHYTLVWDNNDVRLYSNGASQGTPITSASMPTSWNSDIIVIGETELGASVLSDLRFYNSPLTSTEVADLYYSGLVSRTDSYEVDRFGGTDEDPVAIYHFDEGYGSTVRDSSVNGNHLTTYGATWDINTGSSANSVGMRSLKFDGTNNSASSSAQLTGFNFGSDPFSVSGWFKHSSTISDTDTLISQYLTTGYKVYMNSSGFICAGIDDDSTWGPDDEVCSTTSYADSSWHHVEMVKGSTTLNLYVDGNAAGSKTITATGNLSTGAPLYLGADSNGTNFWDGSIDELYFYSYARSVDQVKADYTSRSSAVFGTSTSDSLSNGLVGYWKMDEASTPSLDSSGNALSATWAGTPVSVSGKYGSGISTDYGDSLSTENKAVIAPATETYSTVTWGGWFNLTAASGLDVLINKNNEFKLMTNGSGYPICQHYYSGDPWWFTIASASTIPSGWAHITCTFDGTTGKIYINGSLSGEGSETRTITSLSTTNIGIASPNSGHTIETDEVRVYNRTLSPAEVQKLYNWAPGPVAHWKLDEGSGTTNVYDSSGNGLTGTMMGSMTNDSWIPGKFGSALEFDGSDDYINIGTAADLRNLHANAFTVMGWINSKTANRLIMYKAGSNGYEAGWGVQHTATSGIQMWVNCGTNNAYARSGSNNFSTNTLYHFAISYDNNSSSRIPKIYINGSLVSNSGGQNACDQTIDDDTAYSLTFGGSSYNVPIEGIMDDVKIYNYARTPGQIVQDMNAGHPAPGSPVGSALAHYSFDEGYGVTMHNSGNGGSVYDMTSYATSGLATSGGNNTLTDTGKSWTTNAFANQTITITTGTGSGQSRTVTSNTATVITTSTNWTTNPDSTSTYIVTGPLHSNSGKFGKAAYFNGSTQFISNDTLKTSNTFTYSAWFKPTATSNTERQVMGKLTQYSGQSQARITYRKNIDETKGHISFFVYNVAGSGGASIISSDSYPANNWYHVVGTFDGTHAKLYVNGMLIGTSAAYVGTFNTSPQESFNIGGPKKNQNNLAGSYLQGYIDEVSVYDFSVDANQIKLLYNQGQAAVFGATSTDSSGVGTWSASDAYCPPGQGTECTSPVGHWKLDENEGIYANDKSGNNYRGTLINSPLWVTGKIGSSVNFNGYPQYVSIPGNPYIPEAFTLCSWFNWNGTESSNKDYIASDHNSTGNDYNYGLYRNTSTNKMGGGFRATNLSWYEASTDATIDGPGWNHACVVYNQSQVYMFLNGVRDGSAISASGVTPIDSTGTLSIGRAGSTTGSSHYFHGQIDNVVLYNYARTPAQVAWDYNRGAPVVQYDYNECQGTTLNNTAPSASGGDSGHDATIYPGSGGNTSVGTCSGSANQMWYHGSVGKFNSSIDFDGEDDYAATSNAALIAGNSGMYTNVSWGGWFKPTTTPVSDTLIHKGNEFKLTTNASGYPQCEIYYSSTWNVIAAASSAINTSSWSHLVCTYNGVNGKLYVDGKLVDQKAQTNSVTSTSSTPLSIARDSAGSGYFDGQIDEVKIWNYALTPQQVSTDMNQSSAVRF